MLHPGIWLHFFCIKTFCFLVPRIIILAFIYLFFLICVGHRSCLENSTHLKISSRMSWVGFQRKEQKFSIWGDKRIKDTLIIFTHEWRASTPGERKAREGIKWFWDLGHLFLQGAHLFWVLKKMDGMGVGTLQAAAVGAGKRPSRPTGDIILSGYEGTKGHCLFSCCTCMLWWSLPCKLQEWNK